MDSFGGFGTIGNRYGSSAPATVGTSETIVPKSLRETFGPHPDVAIASNNPTATKSKA
jgi:hypothetical protein